MNDKTHICKFCGEQFDEGYKLGHHIAHLCTLNPNHGKRPDGEYKYSWKCKYCGEIFPTRRKLTEHRKIHYNNPIIRRSLYSHGVTPAPEPCRYCGAHFKYLSGLHLHEKCCNNNPNRVYLAKQSEVMTKETKQKISDSMKRYYAGKTIWYTSKTHRQSYAERYFGKLFIDARRNYHVDRYFLDFAWPERKIYIEVDGEQHYTNKGLEHDKIRTDRLMQCGWKLVKRIRWSQFQKLNKDERKQFINEVFMLLNNDAS